MDLEKLNKNIENTGVVEDLIILSRKVFGNSDDDVKNIIEKLITKSYLMGKKNLAKTIDV